MAAIPIIRQGEDLEFVFDLDGEDISGWICTIFVKRFPSSEILIEREIPPDDRAWPGFLTSTETSELDVSSESPYFLTGKLTNSTTGQERQIPKRFHVSARFASVPGPVFTPLDIPGLAGWYDASDPATIKVTAVTLVDEWLDKSGNENTVTASGGDRPKTDTQTINELNAIEFDGDTDFLEASSFTTTPDLTMAFVIGSIVVDSDNDSILSFKDNLGNFDFQIDADNSSQFFGDFNSNALGGPVVQSPDDLIGPDISLMYRLEVFDSSVKLYSRNILIASDSGNYNGNLGTNQSFKIAANKGGGQHLGVNIGEIVIVNGAISDEDRTSLFNYFFLKWRT